MTIFHSCNPHLSRVEANERTHFNHFFFITSLAATLSPLRPEAMPSAFIEPFHIPLIQCARGEFCDSCDRRICCWFFRRFSVHRRILCCNEVISSGSFHCSSAEANVPLIEVRGHLDEDVRDGRRRTDQRWQLSFQRWTLCVAPFRRTTRMKNANTSCRQNKKKTFERTNLFYLSEAATTEELVEQKMKRKRCEMNAKRQKTSSSSSEVQRVEAVSGCYRGGRSWRNLINTFCPSRFFLLSVSSKCFSPPMTKWSFSKARKNDKYNSQLSKSYTSCL